MIGRTYTLDDLRDRFDALFISVGAGLPIFLGIPGEGLKGVYTANEYLTRVNLMQAYAFPDADTPVLHGDHVVVIGGGNVAIDAVRTARLGARQATIVYRRNRPEMRARVEEIHHAEEEGVSFEFQVSPIAVEGTPTAGSPGCAHRDYSASLMSRADELRADRRIGTGHTL